MDLKYFFHFYFLNTDILVTIYTIYLDFSMTSKALLEGGVSQMFGHSSHFMPKKG